METEMLTGRILYSLEDKENKEKVEKFCKKLVKELKDWMKYGEDSMYDKFVKTADEGIKQSLRIIYHNRFECTSANADPYYSDDIVIPFTALTEKEELDKFIAKYKVVFADRKKDNDRTKKRKALCIDGEKFMMDKVSFRAKSMGNDSWKYGFPVLSPFGCAYMVQIGEPVDFFNSRLTYLDENAPVNIDTVGVYTGMNACKNTIDPKQLKIYSGDVLEITYSWMTDGDKIDDISTEETSKTIRGVVEYEKGGFVVKVFDYKKSRTAPVWYLDMLEEREVTIIGNKMDTPELLDCLTPKKKKN